MPTPEEIKKIAAEIADTLYNEDRTYNHHLWWSVEPKERKAEEVDDIINVILRNYCIVPKSKVQREYKKSYSAAFEHTTCLDRQYARGRYQVLRELFGKSLFEEEK
ncbi:MAG: hypothetical protein K2K82_08760 [Muribaculaceae bacterium]|nr:hypothetical protein [Muribaculaceae bacterium]